MSRRPSRHVITEAVWRAIVANLPDLPTEHYLDATLADLGVSAAALAGELDALEHMQVDLSACDDNTMTLRQFIDVCVNGKPQPVEANA